MMETVDRVREDFLNIAKIDKKISSKFKNNKLESNSTVIHNNAELFLHIINQDTYIALNYLSSNIK